MRFKFRAWNKGNKIMHTENDLMICFNGVLVLRNEKLKCQKLCNPMYEIMQFTGLKDKNGKEIYEGDIINWYDECTIIIKWSDSQAGFYYELLTQKDKRIASFDIRFYRSEESATVIGNIYENPELIKK